MSWYASHIYLQLKQSVIKALSSNVVFANSVFVFNNTQMPPYGLVVIREVCDPTISYNHYDNGYETTWHTSHKHPVISWLNLTDSTNESIILPPELPVLAFGKIHPHKERTYPPLPFLKFLKQLSGHVESTVCFYHHATGAEWAVEQEYAWIFSKEDCVYVNHIGGGYRTVKYSSAGVDEVSEGVREKTPLGSALEHFGIALPTKYFELHTRKFDWNKYKLQTL